MSAWPYKWFTKEECERACETPDLLAYVSPNLLEALDAFREYLMMPIAFSPAVGTLAARTGHRENSYHYPILEGGVLTRPCLAADIVFPQTPLIEAFFAATRFDDFGGIGVYPYWQPRPGLHVDVRAGRMRAYWYRDDQGVYYWLHQGRQIRHLFTLLGSIE